MKEYAGGLVGTPATEYVRSVAPQAFARAPLVIDGALWEEKRNLCRVRALA